MGRVLRAERPAVRVIAVEPARSAVLSGGEPGLHGIQGLGAGFIPKIFDRSLVDEVVTVSDLAADKMAPRLAREEGSPPASNGTVVTILCDSGERYLLG